MTAMDGDDIRKGIGEAAARTMDLDDATFGALIRVTEAAEVALADLTLRGIDPRMAAGLIMGATLEACLPETP